MAEPNPAALLDALPLDAARERLLRCCGSRRWAEAVLTRRPFGSTAALKSAARSAFLALEPGDWLEAFAEHPAIGGDLAAFRAKYAGSSDLSRSEQAGTAGASERTLSELFAGNLAYRERFGFTFIICASGKSASEMLARLKERLQNERETELVLAAREQEKITELRMEKLNR